MNIQFYCSSRSNQGYVYGEKANGIAMRKIEHTMADMFLSAGGIDNALFRSAGRLILVFRNVKTPPNVSIRKDKTGSPIYINIAFIAENAQDEKILRSVLLFSLLAESDFCNALYNAYDENAGSATGYDFNMDDLNTLFDTASASYPPVSQQTMLARPKSLYNNITRDEMIDLLKSCFIPNANCIYFVKTELSLSEYSSNGYLMNNSGAFMPWYVQGSGGVGRVTNKPKTWEKLLKFIKKTPWLFFGGAGAVVLAVIILIIANRTVPAKNGEANQFYRIGDSKIRYEWSADGVEYYVLIFDGVEEKVANTVKSKEYTVKPGEKYSFNCIAHGKNDRKGTSIGSLEMYIPTPSPTPSPTPNPEMEQTPVSTSASEAERFRPSQATMPDKSMPGLIPGSISNMPEKIGIDPDKCYILLPEAKDDGSIQWYIETVERSALESIIDSLTVQ